VSKAQLVIAELQAKTELQAQLVNKALKVSKA
jgi:hypothetical protein